MFKQLLTFVYIARFALSLAFLNIMSSTLISDTSLSWLSRYLEWSQTDWIFIMSQFDSSQHNNSQPKSFFPITITFTIYNGQIENGKINLKILKILVLKLNSKYQLQMVKYQDYIWFEMIKVAFILCYIYCPFIVWHLWHFVHHIHRTEWITLLGEWLYLADLNRKSERKKLDWIKGIKERLLWRL